MSKLKTEKNKLLYPLKQEEKILFSHCNLNDSIQLENFYKQCNEQVLNGIQPVSRDTAIQLAAIQCFIDFKSYKNGVEVNIK